VRKGSPPSTLPSLCAHCSGTSTPSNPRLYPPPPPHLPSPSSPPVMVPPSHTLSALPLLFFPPLPTPPSIFCSNSPSLLFFPLTSFSYFLTVVFFLHKSPAKFLPPFSRAPSQIEVPLQALDKSIRILLLRIPPPLAILTRPQSKFLKYQSLPPSPSHPRCGTLPSLFPPPLFFF